MRHISTYKLFESADNFSDEIISDLNDILLDVTDNGYPYVSFSTPTISNSIFIEICGDASNIPVSMMRLYKIDKNVADVAERISDYVKGISRSDSKSPYCTIEIFLKSHLPDFTYIEFIDSKCINVDTDEVINIIGLKVKFIGFRIKKLF